MINKCAWCDSFTSGYTLIINEEKWFIEYYCSEICHMASIFDLIRGETADNLKLKEELGKITYRECCIEATKEWMQSPGFKKWLTENGFTLREDRKGYYTNQFLLLEKF